MSKPKTPTASGISRLLAKAGFKRSESRPGPLTPPTEGFTVNDQMFGRVRIEHKTGFSRGANADARRDEMLGKYTAFLVAAGYAVERDELWHGLLVEAGKG
jgi:hypothetical protein